MEINLNLVPSKDYDAWLRPTKDNRSFIERSNKQRDLDYFVVELRQQTQSSSNGRKKLSLRQTNPVVCVFNKWQKPLFEAFEEAVTDVQPDPKRSFDSGLAIGGAFYAVPLPHEDATKTRRRNVLLFVAEDDATSLENIEQQLKFSIRAIIKAGGKFDSEQEIMDYIADILAEYPL